jgi:hypothetical protein
VDVVSVSTERGHAPPVPELTPLLSSRGAIEVVSSSRSAIDGPILALAALGDERIAALTPDAVSLYRLRPSPTLEVREALRGPLLTTRRPAGLLLSADTETLWVFTNRTARADLLVVDGRKVVWRSEASAPPGFPSGLVYRPGTTLLEGPGIGPFLAWLPGRIPVVVEPDGGLLPFGGPPRGELRSGPALASFSERVLVASGAAPPAAQDTLIFVLRKNEGLEPLDTLTVPGAVRALAGGPRAVFAALEGGGGAFELLVLEITVRTP